MVFMPCYGIFCGFTWDEVRACLRSCFGSKFGVQ